MSNSMPQVETVSLITDKRECPAQVGVGHFPAPVSERSPGNDPSAALGIRDRLPIKEFITGFTCPVLAV